MGTEHVLAIDLGTGGPKAALVDGSGHIVANEFEPTPLELLGDGGAEQDPDDWWAAITAAVRRVLDGVDPAEVVAVSVTSQWSGTVAVDRDGKHLFPAVIWMDSRGAPYVKELVHARVNVSGYNPLRLKPWIQKTGGIPSHSGKDPLGHILWLRHERPEVYKAAHAFLEPCDYLNARLTGRQCASYDSIVAHWLTDNRDLSKVHYDQQLLGFCGLREDQFPSLVPSASVIGEINATTETPIARVCSCMIRLDAFPRLSASSSASGDAIAISARCPTFCSSSSMSSKFVGSASTPARPTCGSCRRRVR